MGKKIISLFLSLMICLSLFPAMSFASVGTANDVGAQEEEIIKDDAENKEEVVQDETLDKSDSKKEDAETINKDEPSKEKKSVNKSEDKSIKKSVKSKKEPLGSYVYEVNYEQTKINYRDVTVDIPNLANLKKLNDVDTIKVNAKMYYGKTVMQSASKTVKLSDIADTSFKIKLPSYGKFKISASFYKNGKNVLDVDTKTVGVVAEKYNIVPMNASTPVLMYSLKFWDISQNSDGSPIPSIVTLSRYNQYDWNKLPENLYANPLLTKKENASSGVSWLKVKLARMKYYVKELYELNPDSKFVFYVNDYNLRQSLPQVAYENKLPQDSYAVRILTDGSASYNIFQNAYGNESNAQAKHDKLVASYKKFRDKVYSKGAQDYTKLEYGNIRNYTYAILDVEKDAEWWVVRKSTDTFGIKDSSFQSKVLSDSRVTSNYINNLLANVQSKGKEDEFKKLYKFDDSAFKATRKKGKKIMMILGTAKSVEGSPSDAKDVILKEKQPVSDYARFVMAYYGDKYEYYYKGHPGYITESYPTRVKEMNSLGMQILDSSIAAELFAFYNPDIHMSGYTSSTFQNVGSKEADCGLFNITKDSAHVATGVKDYADTMDFFMSNLTTTPNAADEKLKEIINKSYKGHRLFLVEFQNNSKYDIALWDSTTSIITFYKKKDDGSYSFVSRRDALRTQKITTTNSKYAVSYGKTYQFSSKVKSNGTGIITYKSSNPKILAVNASTGKIAIKGTGKVTLSIYASATGIHKATSKKVTFYAVPKKQTISSRKSLKKGTATIKCKGDKRASGYQVLMARNKKFTKGKKAVLSKSYKKTSMTVKKLSRRKTYYVKVRSYKTISGKRYYGSWSKVKTVKIK